MFGVFGPYIFPVGGGIPITLDALPARILLSERLETALLRNELETTIQETEWP